MIFIFLKKGKQYRLLNCSHSMDFRVTPILLLNCEADQVRWPCLGGFLMEALLANIILLLRLVQIWQSLAFHVYPTHYCNSIDMWCWSWERAHQGQGAQMSFDSVFSKDNDMCVQFKKSSNQKVCLIFLCY